MTEPTLEPSPAFAKLLERLREILSPAEYETILARAQNLLDTARRVSTLRKLELQQPTASCSPQAPIARMIVREDGTAEVTLYAPGLPPGEHALYCEPPAPGGQKVTWLGTVVTRAPSPR